MPRLTMATKGQDLGRALANSKVGRMLEQWKGARGVTMVTIRPIQSNPRKITKNIPEESKL